MIATKRLSWILPTASLVIALGALGISFWSVKQVSLAARAAVRSAKAAEQSVRPVLKIMDTALSYTNNEVFIRTTLENIGASTATIESLSVGTIRLGGKIIETRKFKDFADALLYPGDKLTEVISFDRVRTLDSLNMKINYTNIDPQTFIFTFIYTATDNPSMRFAKSLTFSNLKWIEGKLK